MSLDLNIVYSNYYFISISNSIQCVGLPIIVTSTKPHLNFLVDTDASHNAIFSFVHEGLPNYFKELETERNTFGIEGKMVVYKEVKAMITFGDQPSDTIFSIVQADEAIQYLQDQNGFQLHGILGIDFLTKNKWIIDFNNLQITYINSMCFIYLYRR